MASVAANEAGYTKTSGAMDVGSASANIAGFASIGAMIGPAGVAAGALLGLALNAGTLADGFKKLFGWVNESTKTDPMVSVLDNARSQTRDDMANYIANGSSSLISRDFEAESKNASKDAVDAVLARPLDASILREILASRDQAESQYERMRIEFEAKASQENVGSKHLETAEDRVRRSDEYVSTLRERLQSSVRRGESGDSVKVLQEQLSLAEKEANAQKDSLQALVEKRAAIEESIPSLRDATINLEKQEARLTAANGQLRIQEKLLDSIQRLQSSGSKLLQETVTRASITGMSEDISSVVEQIQKQKSINSQVIEQLRVMESLYHAERNGAIKSAEAKQRMADMAKEAAKTLGVSENDPMIARISAEAKLTDIQAMRAEVENRNLIIYQEELKAYEGLSNEATAMTRKIQSQISLLDNYAIGVGASAELRQDAVDALDKEIALLLQQERILEAQVAAGRATAEQKARLANIEADILDKQTSQASLIRSIRDGFISAIGAMNTGAGRFAKIMVSQNEAAGSMLRIFGGAQTPTTGAIQGGWRSGMRVNTQGKFVGDERVSDVPFDSMVDGRVIGEQFRLRGVAARDLGDVMQARSQEIAKTQVPLGEGLGKYSVQQEPGSGFRTLQQGDASKDAKRDQAKQFAEREVAKREAKGIQGPSVDQMMEQYDKNRTAMQMATPTSVIGITPDPNPIEPQAQSNRESSPVSNIDKNVERILRVLTANHIPEVVASQLTESRWQAAANIAVPESVALNSNAPQVNVTGAAVETQSQILQRLLDQKTLTEAARAGKGYQPTANVVLLKKEFNDLFNKVSALDNYERQLRNEGKTALPEQQKEFAEIRAKYDTVNKRLQNLHNVGFLHQNYAGPRSDMNNEIASMGFTDVQKLEAELKQKYETLAPETEQARALEETYRKRQALEVEVRNAEKEAQKAGGERASSERVVSQNRSLFGKYGGPEVKAPLIVPKAGGDRFTAPTGKIKDYMSMVWDGETQTDKDVKAARAAKTRHEDKIAVMEAKYAELMKFDEANPDAKNYTSEMVEQTKKDQSELRNITLAMDETRARKNQIMAGEMIKSFTSKLSSAIDFSGKMATAAGVGDAGLGSLKSIIPFMAEEKKPAKEDSKQTFARRVADVRDQYTVKIGDKPTSYEERKARYWAMNSRIRGMRQEAYEASRIASEPRGEKAQPMVRVLKGGEGSGLSSVSDSNRVSSDTSTATPSTINVNVSITDSLEQITKKLNVALSRLQRQLDAIPDAGSGKTQHAVSST
ncbi:MAG: hypothetical protein HC888_01840 [Candidatus Competibacteraceae bacterium]|nr:hypothetical protein [Candidatus Competibacteraceae bacterium]